MSKEYQTASKKKAALKENNKILPKLCRSCSDRLANEAMKLSKLRRHVETKHSDILERKGVNVPISARIRERLLVLDQ